MKMGMWTWISIIALGEIFWFALVWPLVPATKLGFAIEVIAPLPLIGYMASVSLAIGWLTVKVKNRVASNILGAMLAISVGVVIVLAAYYFQSFLGNNFQYRH